MVIEQEFEDSPSVFDDSDRCFFQVGRDFLDSLEEVILEYAGGLLVHGRSVRSDKFVHDTLHPL